MCVLGGLAGEDAEGGAAVAGAAGAADHTLKSGPHPQCAILRSVWTFTCRIQRILLRLKP